MQRGRIVLDDDALPLMAGNCTGRDGAAPQPYRIAYVHVPKAAGIALTKMILAAKWPVCGLGDTSEARCSCVHSSSCARAAQVVVGEMSHLMLRDLVVRPRQWSSECTVWFALVRDPRSWFYSAAREWCMGLTMGFRRRVPACSNITTNGMLRTRYRPT